MVKNIYEGTEVDTDRINTAYHKTARLVPEGSVVLELGCNEGYFSSILKDKGCHVTGVDSMKQVAQKASKVCDRFILGDLEKSKWAEDLKDGSFDVVVAADVLEHLQQPEKPLKTVRSLLKP